jgi:hypothetical protein
MTAVTLLLIGVGPAAAAAPPHAKLQRLLPDKVPGFVADQPEGNTLSVGGLSIADVSRVYYRGQRGAAETVTVRITDGADNQFLPTRADSGAEFSNEGSSGTQKSYTLNGYPATLHYDPAQRHGTLLVFVRGRYLVQVETKGLEREALEQWWKKINVKPLVKGS